MKKLYEGASIVSAILLVLTAASVFFFNVNNHKQKRKAKRHEHKMESKKESDFQKRIKQINRENEHTRKEIEYYKKLQDPFWHYYDEEAQEMKVLPGPYDPLHPPYKAKDPS